MAINKKTGKIVKPRTLGQKMKATATRAHNICVKGRKPKKKK